MHPIILPSTDPCVRLAETPESTARGRFRFIRNNQQKTQNDKSEYEALHFANCVLIPDTLSSMPQTIRVTLMGLEFDEIVMKY